MAGTGGSKWVVNRSEGGLWSLHETRAGEGVGPRVLSLRPLPSCPSPPDYAEALINPIKHVSLMDQRAKQLAALIGEAR